MKQTKVYSILLFLLLVITSCEEAGITFPESQENITSSGVFEVSFDGALFSTTNVDYMNDNDQIIITVNNPDTNEIFTLKVSAVAKGTYDLMGLDNYATYINNSNPNTADIWTTIDSSIKAGELTITEIDDINNTISGTFSFSGINAITGAVKQFTTGSFSKIPQGTGTTPVASNNTFTAKVDGVAYTATSVSGSLVTVGNTDLILLVGNKSFSETIGIDLNADITPGEYDFGSFIAQTYPTGMYALNGDVNVAVGKLIITSHDTTAQRIEGTFEFEASPIISATPNYSITEGAFDIIYE